MKPFLILIVVIVVTAFAMWLGTDTPDGVSHTQVLGIPVVGHDGFAWLTFGFGNGLLVVGGAGMGVVCLTMYGVGILFATGQLACGLLAFGQAGVGLIMWIGQCGMGTVVATDIGVGGLGDGPFVYGGDGEVFLKRLNEELQETFKLGLIDWLRRNRRLRSPSA